MDTHFLFESIFPDFFENSHLEIHGPSMFTSGKVSFAHADLCLS